VDASDNSPGWKFAQHEMKGVPLRIEIGPKDIAKNQCVAVRRDNRAKTFESLDELETRIPQLLQEVHDGMYAKALERRERMTYSVTTMADMKDAADNKPGFIKAMWCGERACEEQIKEEAGLSSRCMPFEQEELSDVCVCCGRKAKKMVYWGKAY
jgi:prolyl-tRNA synthetase